MTRSVGQGSQTAAVVLRILNEALPGRDFAVEHMPRDEVCVSLSLDDLIPAVSALIERLDVWHLSTITADEVDGNLTLLYHFWNGSGLTLRVSPPDHDLRVPTILALIPGASFYEREIFGMYGIVFEGHPGLVPLLLPDDWDDDPPMRKIADHMEEEP